MKQELRKKQKNAEEKVLTHVGKINNLKSNSHRLGSASGMLDFWKNYFPVGGLTEEQEKILTYLKGDIRESIDTVLTIAHKNDPAVRKDLEEYYHGKCQICQETWHMANGKPFWIAAYLLTRNRGGVAHSGNAVCLCAKHFVKWLYGTISTECDFVSMLEKIPENSSNPEIAFKLADENVALKYNARHFCDLKATLEFYSEEMKNKNQ